MTRIARVFESLKRENRCGLIAYLTAGDPSPEATPALVAALERGGANGPSASASSAGMFLRGADESTSFMWRRDSNSCRQAEQEAR